MFLFLALNPMAQADAQLIASCNPNKIFDAGYSLQIYKNADGTYVGSVSSISWTGGTPEFSNEPATFNVRPTVLGEHCILTFEQKTRKAHHFILTMTSGSPSDKLDLTLDGKKVTSDLPEFGSVECLVASEFAQKYQKCSWSDWYSGKLLNR
jgi:hypothetical protein